MLPFNGAGKNTIKRVVLFTIYWTQYVSPTLMRSTSTIFVNHVLPEVGQNNSAGQLNVKKVQSKKRETEDNFKEDAVLPLTLLQKSKRRSSLFENNESKKQSGR